MAAAGQDGAAIGLVGAVEALTGSAALWDDNPTTLDLLGFSTVVTPILTALTAPGLDPLTMGVYGPWGSGKSTVLELLEQQLRGNRKYVVITTDPWEYEDHQDVKGTLIGVVLAELSRHADAARTRSQRAIELAKDLAERVSWARIGGAVARGVVTMRWEPTELLEAFKLKPDKPRDLVGFRADFAALLAELDEIERVVVLVDDLDRCLPPAVVQTLEAIKLFLAVPKMAFVVAADDSMVRDAIAVQLPQSSRSDRIATAYLEKIVQIPVSLPRLPAHDAEAFVGLLLASPQRDRTVLDPLIRHCTARRAAGQVPLLADLGDLAASLDPARLRLAAQIAQGLGADRIGNPRVIKRFLNAFGVRRSIATDRGIRIDAPILVKLLILEERYRDAFRHVAALEPHEQDTVITGWERWARGEADADQADDTEPPPEVLRAARAWAASPPSLAGQQLGAYLTLAAALTSEQVEVGVPAEMAILANRLLGEGDATREQAARQLSETTPDTQRGVASLLRDQLRRAEELEAPVRALVLAAEHAPTLAGEIGGWLEEVDRRLLGPVAVGFAMSEAPELKELAARLASDERVDEDVRIALTEALGAA
jgi:KAP family P-loop domain